MMLFCNHNVIFWGFNGFFMRTKTMMKSIWSRIDCNGEARKSQTYKFPSKFWAVKKPPQVVSTPYPQALPEADEEIPGHSDSCLGLHWKVFNLPVFESLFHLKIFQICKFWDSSSSWPPNTPGWHLPHHNHPHWNNSLEPSRPGLAAWNGRLWRNQEEATRPVQADGISWAPFGHGSSS